MTRAVRIWISAGALGLAALVASVALAARGGAPSYASCLQHAQTTAAMQKCIDVESARLEGLLAKVYGRLAAKSNKRLLAAAEKRWLAYRTADCKFAASRNAGGSLAPIDAGECRIDDTTQRVASLETYLKLASQG